MPIRTAMSVARGTMPHVRRSGPGVSRLPKPARPRAVHARRWESHWWPNRRRSRRTASRHGRRLDRARPGRPRRRLRRRWSSGTNGRSTISPTARCATPRTPRTRPRRRGSRPTARSARSGRGAKFSTWIFTICYRVCCDRLAKRKRFSGDGIARRGRSRGRARSGQYEAAEEAARLRAAIDALPEKYRIVITLFHFRENSTKRSPRCSACRWER